MPVLPAAGIDFPLTLPVVIVGGGACGMVAALAAKDAGVDPLVIERDRLPAGSTALSSGMVPACGTRQQREIGVDDSPEIMAADIQKKAGGEADAAVVEAVCRASGPAIEWLGDRHGVDFILVEGFLYPGHSRLRMHAPASRTGAALMAALSDAMSRAGIDQLTEGRVADLYADDDGTIRGLAVERPDGSREDLGCRSLILACNGFGGNPGMVQRYIPAMAGANYFGHPGNQGDAVLWGQALGAATRYLSAYQGHGSLAQPHGILISWALMMEGGIQVNRLGQRFSNEHAGYSEQARLVLQQPDAVAWDIYDARLHRLGLEFEDYSQAEKLGAVRRGETTAALAAAIDLPAAALEETLAATYACAEGRASDPFGRDFTTKLPLEAPFYAVKVTGSLFHTQGGLVVDASARVLREDGRSFPNLFAGGGAACGVSGSADWGYLSGNGLLTAVTLGRLGGTAAADLVAASRQET